MDNKYLKDIKEITGYSDESGYPFAEMFKDLGEEVEFGWIDFPVAWGFICLAGNVKHIYDSSGSRKPKNKVLCRKSQPIGNQADVGEGTLGSIRYALNWYIRNGYADKKIYHYLDNLYLLKDIQAGKHPDITEKMAQFKNLTMEYISRECNFLADQLARKANFEKTNIDKLFFLYNKLKEKCEELETVKNTLKRYQDIEYKNVRLDTVVWERELLKNKYEKVENELKTVRKTYISQKEYSKLQDRLILLQSQIADKDRRIRLLESKVDYQEPVDPLFADEDLSNLIVDDLL